MVTIKRREMAGQFPFRLQCNTEDLVRYTGRVNCCKRYLRCNSEMWQYSWTWLLPEISWLHNTWNGPSKVWKHV